MVAPASTRQHNETFDDGTDAGSFSPKAKLWVETMLTPISADDGQPVATASQTVRLNMPGWLVSVFYSAGTNDELARELPASLDVPVLYDAASRAIVGIDIEPTATELEPYRDAAVRYFKRTDSWLAPLRNTKALTGDAVTSGKGMVEEWGSALGDMMAEAKAPPGSTVPDSWSDADIEGMRRNAAILAVRFQKKPKERDAARARALQALPLNAENVRAGAMSPNDFAVMVMRAEVSTAITPEEAAGFRQGVGLG